MITSQDEGLDGKIRSGHRNKLKTLGDFSLRGNKHCSSNKCIQEMQA